MKSWFSKLNFCFKTALISLVVTIAAALGTMCFFWLNLKEIPLGIILGGCVGVVSYTIMGIVVLKEDRKTIWTTVCTITRFLFIAAALTFSGYLYYISNIHLFNVFAVAGAYLVSPICLCITLGKERANNVR